MSSSEETVIAPGGPRQRDQVHLVGPGESVSAGGQEQTQVVPVASAAPEETSDMLLTPGGFRHKSVVHQLEPGHSLDLSSNRVLKRDPSGQVVADLGCIE